MKILFENKQLNEGPGAGYTVSGTLTNVKVNAIKDIKKVGQDGDLIEYEVELDATADFDDVSANSYYYGGTIDSTPVSIIRAVVEFDEGDITTDDIKWALDRAKIDAKLGGGWSHAKFDGFIETDYNGIDNAPSLLGILLELTDEEAIDYLDRAVQDGNTDTLYAVVVDGVQEDAFDTEEEAINYIKQHGGDEVVIIYQTMLFNGDIDVETGETVWTNDDMDESLKESDNNSSDVMKEIQWLLDGIIAIGPDDKINDQTDWKRLYTSASRIKKQLDTKSHKVKESKSLTEDLDDEDRINALADYLGIDPSEISNIYDNEFETPEGDYLVVDEDEAKQLARDDIENLFDDLGLDSFTPDFKDWIIMNALDNEWFEDAVKESYEYYVEDIEDEASSMGYENRLIEEMHDHQVLSDDDFVVGEDGEPDLTTLNDDVDIDSLKEEFIDLLVENAGDPVDYCGDNYGWDWVTEVATQHNLIDMDEVVEQCIYMDGVAHFIARYDGEEHELGNGLYAYRTN
jgi:hypothetical protein